ncbi:MFS transporter [Streptomyces sp. NPDC050287]|uniref:MFS transporter n=1 Tax=Streptomyces sp. NPDC050287 TaxID=3365608 RepID=UPI0037951573
MSAVKHRDFQLLSFGQLLSDVGNWLLVVAVPYHVFEVTGSTLETSVALLSGTLPALLIGPLAGVFVDRWERRLTMLVTDLVRAACVGSMVFAQGGDKLWLLYLLLFSENVFGQFFDPARTALIPVIVGRGRDLASANSIHSLIDGTVRLLGAPLGGILLVATGFTGVLLIDAATYVVSACCIVLVRVRSRPSRSESRAAVRTIMRELGEGIGYLAGRSVLRGILVATLAFALANGALTVLLVPFVREMLNGDSKMLGVLLSALGLGYLVGVPLTRWAVERFSVRNLTAASILPIGVLFYVMFNLRSPVAVATLMAAAGIPGAMWLMTSRTALQRFTADRLMGRASSGYSAVEMTGTLSGTLLGSILAERIGLSTTLDAMSVLLIVTGCAAGLLVPASRGGVQPGEEPAESTSALSEEKSA